MPDARTITEWATGGLLPDLTVLLDLDPRIGLARAGARSSLDRLEAAALEFHEAVRSAFLVLATETPHRYIVLDAAEPAETLAAQVTTALAERFLDVER